jgi:antirestriction protein
MEYADHLEPDEWERDFSERYGGSFRTKEEWSIEFHESTGTFRDVDSRLAQYFDHESFARDAEMSGDIDFIRAGNRFHAFWAH